MAKYDYREVEAPNSNYLTFVKELKKIGQDGWQLIMYETIHGYVKGVCIKEIGDITTPSTDGADI
jgi:hypothetical protein